MKPLSLNHANRKGVVGLLFCLAVVLVGYTGSAYGLLRLEGDQDNAAKVKIAFTQEDDAGDHDQAFSDPDRVIVRLDNYGRRHLGVNITRKHQERFEVEELIDNGSNDAIVSPAPEALSGLGFNDAVITRFGGYIGYEERKLRFASRRFQLPVPRKTDGEVPPGVEYAFEIFAGGMGSGAPPRIEGFNAGDPNLYILEAVAWDIGQLVALQTVDALLFPNLDVKTAAKEVKKLHVVIKQVVNLIKNTPSLIAYWNDGQFFEFGRTALQTINESQLKTSITEYFSKLYAKEANQVLNFASSVQSAFDVFYYAIEKVGMAWAAQFKVVAIRPRIDSVGEADANGRVTITGVGFDPYRPENNQVLFSGPFGITASATIVSVPDEETIIVDLPDQHVEGPVQMCDQALKGYLEHSCSNTDVAFGTRLAIQLVDEFGSPVDENTPAPDFLFVKAELTELPDNPFADGAWLATLYVDGVSVQQKYVQSAQFEFQLDTSVLGDGLHKVGVRITGRGVRSNEAGFRVGSQTDLYVYGALQIIVSYSEKRVRNNGNISIVDRHSTGYSSANPRNDVGSWSGNVFTVSSNIWVHTLRITVHGDINAPGASADAAVEWVQEKYTPNKHLRMKVENVPLTSNNGDLEFEVEGELACNHIREFYFKYYNTNDSLKESELVPNSLYCESGAKVRIRLYLPDWL